MKSEGLGSYHSAELVCSEIRGIYAELEQNYAVGFKVARPEPYQSSTCRQYYQWVGDFPIGKASAQLHD